MLRGQDRVARAKVVGDLDPLANVEVRGIVGAGRRRAGFVVVAGKGVHTEVIRDAEAQSFKLGKRRSARGGGFRVQRKRRAERRGQKSSTGQSGRTRQNFA